MHCEKCGQKLEPNALFCENCGAKIEKDTAVEPEQDVAVYEQKELTTEGVGNKIPKFPKKLIIGIVAAVVIVAAAALIIPGLGGDASARIIYAKENQLNIFAAGMETPTLLTEDLYENSSNFDNFAYDDYGYLTNTATATENGKGVYYITDIDYGKGKLYYKDFGKAAKDSSYEGEHIASGVYNGEWTLIDDETLVYTKEGGLYLYAKGEEIKLKSDTRNYTYSEGTILYKTDEGDLYTYEINGKGESTKIASNVDVIVSYTSGFGEIYVSVYDENYTLYKYTKGKDKEKISGGIDSIMTADEGTIYYIKKKEGSAATLYDYVTDNLAESDSQAVEPNIADYQTEELVSGWYNDYYTTKTDYDAYREAYTEYNKIARRESLRESLKEQKITSEKYTLYCYKDGKENTVSENIADINEIYGVGSSSIKTGVFYTKMEEDSVQKVVNIEDLYYYNDVYGYIDRGESSGGSVYGSFNGQKEILLNDKEDYFVSYVRAFGQGNLMIELNDQDYNASLFVGTVGDGKLTQVGKTIEDVNSYNVNPNTEELYYYTDVESNHGTLYAWNNGKPEKISDDVYYARTVFNENGDFMFLKDYSSNNMGTLYAVKNKSQVKIADDVHDMIFAGNDIYYLQDYSSSNMYGDLYQYIKEGKRELVDSSVTSFGTL